jgi:FKBP-type peptidyl-prolyl cis-trans isomerase
MGRLKISWFLFIILMILTTGCPKSTWEEQEQKMIDDYIKSLGDTAYVHYPSGLYYIELIPGTGRTPVDYDTVYFKYEAKFLDHVTWDTNDPDSVPYKHVMGTEVGRVIAGVDEGLRYMKEGGKSKFLTPSSLAYGFEGIWQIVPGYTPLLWVIELDSVKAGPGK